MGNRIAILLSTYNGSSFLKDQLESIFAQTFQGFTIYIRDDKSTDNTLEIVNQYREKHKNIVFVQSYENIGAKNSFFYLLNYSLKDGFYDYFMFADQDDIWLPFKIKLTLEKMKALETGEIPLLVHTDLKVVDENAKILSPSFWKYQNLNPQKDSLNRLLVQNVVTGCTMMLNRPLVELCQYGENKAIMHDWWISLVAASFGKIGYVDQPTILYRQHRNNSIGAIKINFNYIYRKMWEKEVLKKNFIQVKDFYRIFEDKLNEQERNILKAFIKFENLNFFNKLITSIVYRFFKNGLLRNVGFFFKLIKK